MHARRRFTLAALLALGGAALAAAPPRTVVLVRYRVREQHPERVLEQVTNPVERWLAGFAGVMEMNSVTGHGTVQVELQFERDATDQDAASVARRLDQLALAPEAQVLARSVELGPPVAAPGRLQPQPR